MIKNKNNQKDPFNRSDKKSITASKGHLNNKNLITY